jgi:plasmid stabilization system protein ParE
MAHSVYITVRALAEIDEALEWIADQMEAAALRWHERLIEAIYSLQDHPERCELAPESDWFGAKIRQLLYGKRFGVYRILFEIRGSKVIILRVRHSAQALLKPEEL